MQEFMIAPAAGRGMYLTDMSRVVYIPTAAGHSVLLRPAEPDQFLSALRAISAKP